MNLHKFPLDHFGLVTSPIIEQLLRPVGDKRKRKTAMKALCATAKSFGQIENKSKITYVGLLTDAAGQIWLTFVEENPTVLEPRDEDYVDEPR